MSIDLNALSRGELIKLRADVDRAIASLAERERKAALEAAERAVAQYGFSLAELTGMATEKPRRRARQAASPAKYRNPANPAQTWPGRGRKPKWVVEHEAAGRPLAELAV
jgi:DNA-binding protein H-NS